MRVLVTGMIAGIDDAACIGQVLARGAELGLEIAHFDRLWPIAATREEAIALLKAAPAGDDAES